jgi:hypothetical protein
MKTHSRNKKENLSSKRDNSFQQLMKKALNTPLPKNYKENKPKKKK